MQATAKLTFDREYYEKCYDEWLRHRSRYRRVAIPIALILIGIGLALAYWMSSLTLAIIITVVGVADVVETLTYRKRWMKSAQDSQSVSRGELQFTSSEVQLHSEHANGTVRYEGFQSAIATPKGVFLVPHKGASIFVPLSTIEPPEVVDSLVTFLLERINRS